MNYKGYGIETEYIDDYPEPNNWRIAVYDLSNNEYRCVWLNYFPSEQEAIEVAKGWIDEHG
jgi:hypothetical protein